MTPERKMQDFEARDQELFREALKEIQLSPPLRALLRRLYADCGMALNPFTTNALTTAHNAGKMAVGQEFFGYLNEMDPSFLPGLMREMNDERNSRNNDLLTLQRQRRDAIGGD